MPLGARWQAPAALALFALGAGLIAFDLRRTWAWHHPRDDGGYSRADWSAPYGGGTHVSGYTFRDRNRNGRYDGDETPLAGVAIELTDERGGRTIERTNLSGFANFSMSLARRDAQIRRPGEVKFRVRLPPGWLITSGNGSQATTIEPLLGAPADLVAKNPPRPVGLAPALSLAGRCLERQAGGGLVGAADVAITATGPGGGMLAIRSGPDGAFRLAAEPGVWRLAFARAGSALLERAVEVRDAPVVIAGLLLGDERPQPSGQVMTIDFESVTGTPVRKMPNGQNGLDWSGLNVIEAVSVDGGDGYANTLSSGHYVAYNSSGHPVSIERRSGFDMRGGYFGIALPHAEGERLVARAYRRGVLVADDEVELSVLGPLWLDTDYRDVERVELSTRHYWQFAVDDLMVSLRDEGDGSPSGGAGAPSAVATAPPKP